MYNSTSNSSNSAFYNALMCPSTKRTEEDINVIYNFLRQLNILERVNDAPLRSVCRTARLECRPAGYVLFSFGRRNSMNLRRNSDCVVVQPSDMIVIDYPDVQTVTVHHQQQNSAGSGGGNHKLSQAQRHSNVGHQQSHFLDDSSNSEMYQFYQAAFTAAPRKQSATTVGTSAADNKSSTMIRRCCASPSTAALGGGGISGNAAAIAGYNNEVVAHNCSPSSSVSTSNAHHKLPPPSFLRNSSNSVLPGGKIDDGSGDGGTSHSYGKLNNNYFIVNNNKLCAPSLKVVTAPAPPTTSDNANRLHCASGASSTQHFGPEHIYLSDNGGIKSSHPFRRSFHMEELHNIQADMDANLHVNSSQTPNAYRFQRNDSPSRSEMQYQSQYQAQKHRFYGPNRWPPSMMINTNTINNSNSAVAENQISQHNFYLYHHQRGSSEQPPDALVKSSHNYNNYSMQASQSPPSCTPSTSGASVYHRNYWSSNSLTSNNSQQQRHQLTLPISGANDKNEKNLKHIAVNDSTVEGNCSNIIADNTSSSQIVMTGTGTLTSRSLVLAADENRMHNINSNNSALLPPFSSSQHHHHLSGHCRRKSDASGPPTNGSGGGLTVVKVRAQHGAGSATSLSSSTGGGNRKILRARSTASSTASGRDDGDEFSGLPETAVDSDYDLDDDDEDEDESCPSHDSFQELRDNVRECLEKDPAERCAEDISTLMEFMHQMQALANLPLSIKRQLCLKMVFAIVPEAGTVIMRYGERIDSWSVVVNGAVEHIKSSTGERIEYRLGECFGVEPNPQPQYHDGEMRTLVDDCEFVLVEHGDFCSIMCTLNQHIEREADNSTGEVVREAERRVVGNQVELLITKALPDRLVSQLVADDFSTSAGGGTTDAHFIEDFLLMYRVFIRDPTTIVRRLLDWFRNDRLCGRNGSLVDDNSVSSTDNDGQHRLNSSYAVSFDDCGDADDDMVVVEDGVPRHFISGEDSGDLDETMTSTNNHPSDGNRYEQHQQHGSVIAGSGGTRRYRERVARIILLWANNHFSDFESNIEMMRLLDEFEQSLDEAKMHNQQTLLNITCSVKSKPRVITLTRSDRNQPLPFRIGGVAGSGSGGIFISEVEPNSMAERAGLKRGDEILEMNNHSFKQITPQRAHDLLCDSTHISLTIKSNLMGFKEMLFYNNADAESVGSEGRRLGGVDADDSYERIGGQHSSEMMAEPSTFPAPRRHKSGSTGGGSSLASIGPGYTSAARLCQAINNVNNVHTTRGAGHQSGYGPLSKYATASSRTTSKMFDKLFTLLKGSSVTAHEHAPVGDEAVDSTDEAHSLRTSRSNPDISAQIVRGMPGGAVGQSAAMQAAVANRHSSFSANNTGGGGPSSYLHSIEQAVKVYRADQSFRYLIVYPDTTARGLVQMALQEFGVHQNDGASTSSADWTLYECTVTREGVIKQRRLPDDAHGLADRIALSSRFYLRNCARSENLLPDELAPELLKESRFGLYTLSAQFVATQLTIQDFAVFSSIEPTEYVDSLFQLGDESTSWPHLCTFEAIFNREMWWVVTEICAERNVYRRSKLIKKFIKVARFCRDLRNFNSMFAIVSGLEKPAVRRLSHSWERVSGKYMKMFADIQQLMDPSRNMSKYRQHLASVALDPPVIPIYPILRKDLIFAHEANPTFVGKLINFEKLRMIARIIRSIQRLNSVQFDVELVNAQMAHGIDLLSVSTGGSAALAMRRLGGAASKQASAAMTGLINGSSSVGGGPSSSATSSGQSSRRKLYERMLMLRKVKAYLSDLPCCDSEPELDRRSLECEPAAPGVGGSGTIGFSASAKAMNGFFYGSNGGGSTASSKMEGSNSMSPLNATGGSGGRGSGISSSHHRRLASPSPSSLSSISGHSAPVESGGAQPQHWHHNNRNQLPKFGAESPHAVQKMMSLVQNSKVLKQQTAPSSPTLTRLNATMGGGGGGNGNIDGFNAKRASGQNSRHSLAASSKRSLSRGRSVGGAAESEDEDADQTLLLTNERIVE